MFYKEHICAVVRSTEQAKALSSLGINVLQFDLADEQAVVEAFLLHKSMNLSISDSFDACDN